ncbi:MAG: HNH endonuclease [Propionibacteriales bacterium]|nr:HNH endonuclease [Propionibacteriales bacterium]
METDVLIPAGQALAEVARLLDRVDPDRGGVAPETRLEWVRAARHASGRLQALTALLVGEADRAQAAERVTGTPLTSWLGMGETLSRKEAAAAVGQAKTMRAHPEVAEAAVAGRVGAGQVRSIGRVLDSLSARLDEGQQVAAEHVLVELAAHLDADQLAKAAPQVLAQVAPATSDELLETKLQREAEAAHRARSLRFFREGGSLRFEGSLPRVEGERFVTLLNAHAEQLRRTAIEARDPLAGHTSPEQRRADALVALLTSVEKSKPVAGLGAARVVVTLDHQRLRDDAAHAGLLTDDQPISAGELRRLCCDAEIVPVVLGGPSEVLDVGRAKRLVSDGIRIALTVRDGGCAFPGCDVRPELCEAHHIVPWWADGSTALGNLVLLCHHHHSLVEPTKYGLRDQWQVEIASDGLPQFIPPARFDAARRPRRHRRRASPEPAPAAPAAGPDGATHQPDLPDRPRSNRASTAPELEECAQAGWRARAG